MSSLTTASAAELAGRIAAREVSSEEVTRAHLDRIDEVDGEINAFLHVGADEALWAARIHPETPAAALSARAAGRPAAWWGSPVRAAMCAWSPASAATSPTRCRRRPAHRTSVARH